MTFLTVDGGRLPVDTASFPRELEYFLMQLWKHQHQSVDLFLWCVCNKILEDFGVCVCVCGGGRVCAGVCVCVCVCVGVRECA